MRTRVICKILGMLLMLFSGTYIIPILVSVIYEDGKIPVFIYSFLITFSLGALIWIPFSKHKQDLRARDGFLITLLFWLGLGLAGSLPFILSTNPTISTTDAVFESISGLTTTGATIIAGLDNLPESLLFYRQFLQWIGGIGIVVIAVAILPILGVGGMQLYKAEAPGPVKDNKLTPRIAETAKALFLIYLSLTFMCALAYWLAGMSGFDAIAHSFSTVSIGGFSTHDQSMAYFLNTETVNGDIILLIASCFMLISGVNFALHYYFISHRSIRPYLQDSEAKSYLALIVFSALMTVIVLMLWQHYAESNDAFRHGLFQTVSIITTTGFTTTNFSEWPLHITYGLIFLAFIGACAGSTGGGIKVGRILILGKQTLREITRLIHPAAIVPIKVSSKPVHPKVANAIWGFFGAYLIIFHAMTILMLTTGLDYVTAWSAVAASINNLGPGLGEVALNYSSIGDAAKWILCLCMVLGRLELFTLIVLLTPMYWRS